MAQGEGMSTGKQMVSSGTVWEEMAGYSRAVRIGDHIYVSGTTATGTHGPIGGHDPMSQAHAVLDKIEAAIQQLGGQMSDVVRTRVYVPHIDYWEPVARVHGARFHNIRPANTLIVAQLIGSEYLVEIEAEAIIGAGGSAQ
jgi:enamine deaminase RidA (YjgF/YER057c/UK114 family)